MLGQFFRTNGLWGCFWCIQGVLATNPSTEVQRQIFTATFTNLLFEKLSLQVVWVYYVAQMLVQSSSDYSASELSQNLILDAVVRIA